MSAKIPTLLIGGDFSPQQRVAEKFERKAFGDVLDAIVPIVSESDYSIVNLECPIVEGQASPIKKTGPSLKCTSSTIDALKYAGFIAVTLANNHFRDYGETGVSTTLAYLDRHGIAHVGGGLDLESASKPLHVSIGGKSVTILNCCEHEWSIATKDHGGSNPIDFLNLYYQIQEARKVSEFVIVILHGGRELYKYPTPRMQKSYRYLIDVGADVVVNHHQHCFSGYEIYHQHPIFYGLGYFLFDKGGVINPLWHEGYLVQLSLGSEITFKTIPYYQCGDTADVKPLAHPADFEKRLEALCDVISDEARLQSEFDRVVQSSISTAKGVVDPHFNRYIGGLVKKLGGPYLQTKKGYMRLLANIQCETHRDVFLSALRKIVNKQ